jgi:hypothetical protein
MAPPNRSQINSSSKAVVVDENSDETSADAPTAVPNPPPRYTVWNLAGDFLASFPSPEEADAFLERMADRPRPWSNGKGERIRFLADAVGFELTSAQQGRSSRAFTSWAEVFHAGNPPADVLNPSISKHGF